MVYSRPVFPVADVKIAVLPLINGNVIEVPLLATNAAIAIGDALETTGAGTIDLKSGAGEIVGFALIAAVQNAGATAATRFMKVLVQQYTATA
jgi:hypothetical protein